MSEWDELWELYPFDLLDGDDWGAPLMKSTAVKIKAIGDDNKQKIEAIQKLINEAIIFEYTFNRIKEVLGE